MKRSLLSLAFMSSIIVTAACGENNEEQGEGNPSNDDETFEVAVIPSQSIGEMEEGLSSLEDHLSKQLSTPVEVTHYPNYNAVVEAINYSHVDLAYFGPVTYLIAYEQSGAEAVVTQSIDGNPYYYSYIVTQPDAPWDSLDELLKNVDEVDFAFGSQSSTSGFTIPGYELMERNVYENEGSYEFSSVRFTGSHDITANAVANGDVDAGAIDSAIFQALINEGAIEEDDYKIIWESQQLYQYPWAVPHDTEDDRKDQIREAFLMIEDEEILSIFGGADEFVEASHEEYDSILEAARTMGLLDPEEDEDN
ncbi:phosphate/phosphite/phosphonate ABC transporter substrate-binding protein [Salipaludibacillus aurantiacus]|uniref:Phosphonate transport system substrate-binding protein n=1 Tax=Salipaludibacillus aurantiacus TaxID=1601833 RepID=A0A1H9W300_9BACI|nr:phosphate/phosphite/phosphonate ABC transporter substrate-binding protein [Salipaludibacillus aurantiacus]SES28275.1 phosphonate transport system substrate-binding protein [Salipaludibacillus aurantiacus]